YIGRKTSNGERFKQNKLTAAHKTLPFGTKVKVTNLSNGQSVKVRINDRGPFIQGRIIDLSKKAAKKIDMVNTGVTKVTIRY
ncbi:MAG: septal ring lytic transglycosylase RlpA family protein, partial [Sediminibacterium sp.]|nr:septal ring lytic transglycosylase RlpA family protein [Sediminibacterium sp.]